MTTKLVLSAMILSGAVLAPQHSDAATLYFQDYAGATAGSIGPTAFGGFGAINNVGATGWQIQGGGGGGGISVTTGINNTGVGGSQALFANWDHSAATDFTFNQETVYGAIAAPGAGFTIADIQVDLAIFISGSSSTTPLSVIIFNNGSNWTFTPTLVNGAFTSVSFSGAQTTQGGANPFDPLAASNLQIGFGAGGGFGFDANNIVTLDNILVTSVPEPGSLLLGAIGAFGLAASRRRRS